MSRSMFIIVSDNQEEIASAKRFCESLNVSCKIYSSAHWENENGKSHQPISITSAVPSLASGAQPIKPVSYVNNVVPFPTPVQPQVSVTKIEDLEQQAIINAIGQYNGNLTEAAKALGIGRATLYRRVKYFKIDPNQSRKRRAA